MLSPRLSRLCGLLTSLEAKGSSGVQTVSPIPGGNLGQRIQINPEKMRDREKEGTERQMKRLREQRKKQRWRQTEER
jgi:hypothetical protein